MGKLESPVFMYDSLDKPNAPQHTPVTKKDSPWPVITLVVMSSLFLAGIIIFVITWLLQNALYSGFAAFILNTFIVVVVFALAVIFVAIAVYAVILAFNANIRTLTDGVPYSPLTVWSQGISTQKAADSYYGVMQERAKQSRFQGVQTLTLDESSHTETSTTSVGATDDDSSDETIPVAKDKSTLEDLKDKGHIGRSNNSIMVGYTNGEA